MVKNPLYSAGPGQGTKIPHAEGQLSLCATTIELTSQLEPAHHNYRAHVPWSLRTTTREEKTRRPQLERSTHAAMKDPACLNEDPACRD